MTETYSGYANRETWALSLWLNNDEGLYNWALEMAEDAVRHDLRDYEFADVIKDWVEEMFDDYYENPKSHTHEMGVMVRDIGSLWRVDWEEIGNEFLELAREE